MIIKKKSEFSVFHIYSSNLHRKLKDIWKRFLYSCFLDNHIKDVILNLKSVESVEPTEETLWKTNRHKKLRHFFEKFWLYFAFNFLLKYNTHIVWYSKCYLLIKKVSQFIDKTLLTTKVSILRKIGSFPQTIVSFPPDINCEFSPDLAGLSGLSHLQPGTVGGDYTSHRYTYHTEEEKHQLVSIIIIQGW